MNQEFYGLVCKYTKLTSTSKETGTVEVGYIEDGHYHLEPVIETKEYKIHLVYNQKDKWDLMFYYNIDRPTGGIGIMGNDANTVIRQKYLDNYVNKA